MRCACAGLPRRRSKEDEEDERLAAKGTASRSIELPAAETGAAYGGGSRGMPGTCPVASK
jgi:hypothetical protein